MDEGRKEEGVLSSIILSKFTAFPQESGILRIGGARGDKGGLPSSIGTHHPSPITGHLLRIF